MTTIQKERATEVDTLSPIATQRVSATQDEQQFSPKLGPREPLWMRVDRFLNDLRATRGLPC